MTMSHIIIKNKLAKDRMRIAGSLLSEVMSETSKQVVEGTSTFSLDTMIEGLMRKKGLIPECKGYGSYEYASCISINDVIVHGVPSKEVILKSGDFVKIDIVGSYKGYCADMARYFFVGEVSSVAKKLADVAQKALDTAISKVAPGVFLSDISSVVQTIVEDAGFSVIRDFAGHGIGKSIHEEPEIPNYGTPGEGPILREGMTLAIEPMIAEKHYGVKIMPDGWTAKTQDGGLAAHVEDTLLVTSNGVEILTRP